MGLFAGAHLMVSVLCSNLLGLTGSVKLVYIGLYLTILYCTENQ